MTAFEGGNCPAGRPGVGVLGQSGIFRGAQFSKMSGLERTADRQVSGINLQFAAIPAFGR